MATYLATVDTGNWVFKNGTTPGGVPETVAVDPTLIQSQPNAVDFFYDTSAEAGSATRSRWPTGTTSGSTRASRRSRSTCGWTTRARGPRSSRSMRTTRGRRPPRSGGSSWPTRSATRCSPRPLPPRRHDAAGAADEDRRRAVLRDPPHLGGGAPPRKRHHGAVHGAL